jgi:hypothetical protein
MKNAATRYLNASAGFMDFEPIRIGSGGRAAKTGVKG